MIFDKFLGFIFNFLNSLSLIYWIFRNNDFKNSLLHHSILIKAYFLKIINLRYYKKQILSFSKLKDYKKSDTLFVMGSGYSINSIEDNIWKKINKHDSIGFNGTYYLEKIDITYHITRAGSEGKEFKGDDIFKYFVADKIKNNDFYKNTVFLFSKGYSQHFPNLLLGTKVFNFKNNMYFFNTNKFYDLPKGSLFTGLIHKSGTLIDALSFGYYMGYKNIVLLGVDLYDNRYFWANPNKTVGYSMEHNAEIELDATIRGIKYNEKHNTVNNGIIEIVDRYNKSLLEKNVTIYVYNPKSLLSEVLPIFNFKKL